MVFCKLNCTDQISDLINIAFSLLRIVLVLKAKDWNHLIKSLTEILLCTINI